ncbi:MAG: di-heme oxidoredictase family protein, partial [Myxococcota bacterium]
EGRAERLRGAGRACLHWTGAGVFHLEVGPEVANARIEEQGLRRRAEGRAQRKLDAAFGPGVGELDGYRLPERCVGRASERKLAVKANGQRGVRGEPNALAFVDGLEIRPLTDLLLHDLGPGLDDGSGAPLAREWRTPPLWGLSVRSEGFLHDGRARTLEEAILWHGGEGAAARARFASWSRSARQQLLAFVQGL